MKHATFINPNIYEKRFESILNNKGIDYKKEGELDYIVKENMIEVKGLRKDNWRIILTYPQREYIMSNRSYVVVINSTAKGNIVINPFQIRRLLTSARVYDRRDGVRYYLLYVRWMFHKFRSLDSYLDRWVNCI